MTLSYLRCAVRAVVLAPTRARRWLMLLLVCTTVCAATSGSLTYETTWVGNTLVGGNTWVPNYVSDMFVDSTGSVYTHTRWDEKGGESMVFRNGAVTGVAYSTHGWGNYGGDAITGNANYMFLATRMDSQGGALVDPDRWPANGTYWYGISRRQRADYSVGAPFPGCKTGSGGAFLIVESVPSDINANIAGLAASADRLFVSDPYAGLIRIYDANSMAVIGSFPFANPGKLALDGAGNLWIAQSDTAKVVHCSPTGLLLGDDVTGVYAGGLAIDNLGRLMVADVWPDKVIKIYDITSAPVLVRTFGVPGGTAAGAVPGKVEPLKFNWLTGCGADAAGNIYVSFVETAGGTVVRAFSPSGAQLWQVYGLEFQKSAAVDPVSEDIISPTQRYRMDWSKPLGEESTWWASHTDDTAYPSDPRNYGNHFSSRIAYIEGHRFLVTTVDTVFMVLYRYDGEIAIPAVIFSAGSRYVTTWRPPGAPSVGRWLWRDANGDGQFQAGEFTGDGMDVWSSLWSIDAQGDVYQGGSGFATWQHLQQFRCGGLDSHGVPSYSIADIAVFDPPAPFTT